jgi:hypothetical protein
MHTPSKTLACIRRCINERLINPVALAQRAAKMYGKKKSYGKWFKAEKGGHIPLSSYNGRTVNSVERKSEHVYDKLGGSEGYHQAHRPKTFEIRNLNATQPFVHTNDVEKLRNKISDTQPSHITVATHKGKHYIMDGHHAVMAAKLRGDKTITTKHIDLDKY